MPKFKYQTLFDKIQGMRVRDNDYYSSNDFDTLLQIREDQGQIVRWHRFYVHSRNEFYMQPDSITIPMGWLPEDDLFMYELSGNIESIGKNISKEYFVWKDFVREGYVDLYLHCSDCQIQ